MSNELTIPSLAASRFHAVRNKNTHHEIKKALEGGQTLNKTLSYLEDCKQERPKNEKFTKGVLR